MLQKILKKFHFIDIIGIAIFFGILAAAAFFFLRRSDFVTITLRVSDSDAMDIWSMPPIWYVNALKPGMQSKDVLGRPTLEVLDVYDYRSRENSSLAFIKIRARAVYNKRTNEYSYNGANLLVGSYQQFRVQGFLIPGIVHSVNTNEQVETKKFIVKGYINPLNVDPTAVSAETIATGVPLYFAQQVKEGMQLTDGQGNILAKISSVTKSPGQRRFIYNGQLITVRDPQFERVEMTVEILGEKYGENFFFRLESPIIINSAIYLNFKEITVPFTITAISPA